MSAPRHASLARRILAPVVCAITLGMAIAVWCFSTGNPLTYFAATVPPGQTLYVFSKLLGLLGIVMFWFQAMAGLARTTPALRGFPALPQRAHLAFGIATFIVIAAHVAAFIAASTMRTQHAAFGLLLPDFDQGYYRTMVGLGAIAFWIVLVALLGGWRRLRGGSFARWLHRLVFLALLIGFIHGLAVGSETRFGLMKYVYAFIGLSLGTAVLSWAWHALRRPRLVPGSAAASIAAANSGVPRS